MGEYEKSRLQELLRVERRKLVDALRNKNKNEIKNIKATISMIERRMKLLNIDVRKQTKEEIKEAIKVLEQLHYDIYHFEEVESSEKDVKALEVALEQLKKVSDVI